MAGQVEQELTVGTLTAARATLTAKPRVRLHGLTLRDPDRDGVAPERLHMTLLGGPEQGALDAATDAVVARRAGAKAFWAEYREWVTAAFDGVIGDSYPSRSC